MEEVHGIRVAPVLAADSDREARPGCPAFPDRDLDEPPDAFAVDRLERRDAEDAQLEVLPEERQDHWTAERDDIIGVGAQLGVRAARSDGGARHSVRLKLYKQVSVVVPGGLSE
jgi:hypothetical protein